MAMNNWGSTPHHPPGTDKAVKQKHAIADGYAMASSPSTVKVDLGKTTTGACKVPGLTMRK